MKKLVLFMLSLMLVVCTAISVSAAELSEPEANILDKLSETVMVDDVPYNFPAQYVLQAENYMLSCDITESQSEKVIKKLDKIIAAAKTDSDKLSPYGNVYNYLSESTKTEIKKIGMDILKILDLSVSYDGENIDIVDTEGYAWFSDEPVVKKTGVTQSMLVPMIIAVSSVVLFGSRIIYRKVRG